MSILNTDPNQVDDGQGNASVSNGNSDNQADWRSLLPEDLRGDKSFESIKGKDWSEAGPILAKNYVNAQKLVGAEKLVIPGKDASPEQIADFRKKLGVPEKPDDYVVTYPEGLTEEEVNKDSLTAWRARLHAQGVPKAAAENLIKEYLTEIQTTRAGMEEARGKQLATWQTELKQKFGDKYDTMVNYGRFALEQFKSDELVDWLETSGAGDHPAVVEFFSKVGQALSDDRIRGGGNSGNGSGRPATAAQAQDALNEFNRDKSKQSALWDPKDPNHEAAVKERSELFRLAYPDMSDEK